MKPSTRRIALLAVAAAPLVLAACGDDNVTTPSAATANVRVAHLSPDAPPVDVYVNGTKALSNVPFQDVSSYLPVPAGSTNFRVTPANADYPGRDRRDRDPQCGRQLHRRGDGLPRRHPAAVARGRPRHDRAVEGSLRAREPRRAGRRHRRGGGTRDLLELHVPPGVALPAGRPGDLRRSRRARPGRTSSRSPCRTFRCAPARTTRSSRSGCCRTSRSLPWRSSTRRSLTRHRGPGRRGE